MLCKIKNCHKIGFGIFCLVFAVVLSVFFYSDTSYAVSDVTGQLSSSTPNYTLICDNRPEQGGPLCSDYSYLILESSSIMPSSGYWQIQFGSYNAVRLPFDSFMVFIPNELGGNGNGVYFANPTTLGDVVYNYTLTNSLGSLPSGSITLSQNGTYDVSSYAEAVVDVPPEVVQGDYHDDLVNIKESILVCGAILLVLYFFFCIYRLIIRNSGVK